MLKVTHGPKIDYEFCNGCKRCYLYCPVDVFGWDEEKGRPTLAYPEECWLNCVVCELECPELAINVEMPFQLKFFWSLYPQKEEPEASPAGENQGQ